MPYRTFPNQEFRNVLQTHLEIPALLRAFPIHAGARILEVGCGRGVALARIATLCRPSRLVGLDVDAAAIEIARDRVKLLAGSIELFVGDVRNLPFADAEFDVVVDFGTCYHVDRPRYALSEIARVLRDDGQFIHETPLAQLLAHPIRTAGRRLPWSAVPALASDRSAGLWAARRRSARVVGHLHTGDRHVLSHA